MSAANVQERPVNLADDDSAKAVLASLERERGALFTPKEYAEMRNVVLQELARGPQFKRSILVTFGVIGFFLVVMTVLGIALLAQDMVPDPMLAVAGLAGLWMWGYLLRAYVRSIRQQALLSLDERLAELKGLRAENLITQEEYDRIYAAIHTTRGAPRE
jgi:hypothetical protein